MYGYGFDNGAYASMQRQLEQLQSQTQIGQPGTNIVWVQGVEGAKGYQIPNKSNILVLDSENEDTMYIISSDEVGMRKMRKFRFHEEEIKQPGQVDTTQFVTREDVKSIIMEMFGTKEDSHDETVQGTGTVK